MVGFVGVECEDGMKMREDWGDDDIYLKDWLPTLLGLNFSLLMVLETKSRDSLRVLLDFQLPAIILLFLEKNARLVRVLNIRILFLNNYRFI